MFTVLVAVRLWQPQPLARSGWRMMWMPPPRQWDTATVAPRLRASACVVCSACHGIRMLPPHLATSRDGAIAATGAEDTSVVLWAQATDKDSITSPDGAAAEVVAYALACLTPQFQQHQSDIITRPVLSPEDSNHEVGVLRNTHSAAAAAAARGKCGSWHLPRHTPACRSAATTLFS